MPDRVSAPDPLERLKELEAAASEGPWDSMGSLVYVGTRFVNGKPLAQIDTYLCEADASLIAELRNRAASLIEVAEAAREVVHGKPSLEILTNAGLRLLILHLR